MRAQNLRGGSGGTGGTFSAPRVRPPVPGVGLPRGRGRLSLRDSAGLTQKVSARGPIVQLRDGHLRVQSSNTCVFFEFRGLPCTALAPTKSSPASARGHTGTDGAFVEGLVALGLLEFHNERRDGV